jgi:hypothetical protein
LAHRYIQLSEAMASKSIGKSLHKRASSTLARIESSRPHIAPIPDRSILEITGKDAQKFLKGLTSRDVAKSPGWGYSGFLTPTVSFKSLQWFTAPAANADRLARRAESCMTHSSTLHQPQGTSSRLTSSIIRGSTTQDPQTRKSHH